MNENGYVVYPASREDRISLYGSLKKARAAARWKSTAAPYCRARVVDADTYEVVARFERGEEVKK